MPQTRELRQVINEAYNGMVKHPQHALSPWYRYLIYNIFGPVSSANGYKTRTTLAILAAEYALPIWREALADDPLLDIVLQMARAVLNGQANLEEARTITEDAWNQLVELDADSEEKGIVHVVSAGFAAVESLREALGKDPFKDILVDESTINDDLDPYHTDTAQFAVDAFAGPSWLPTSSSIKRQVFWEWWLLTAIPQLWSDDT